MGCPLCGQSDTALFHEDRVRHYFRCHACNLVFVPPESHLAADEERRRYDLHENDPADPAYCAFLGRLVEPLIPLLPPGASGLDYGSGPGPALWAMMREAGFEMALYDPIYAPDEEALAWRYDFITCTETVEHFRDPATEWRRMAKLLRPGGLIGVMTQTLDGVADFSSWHYMRDETHVCFYSRASFGWIAKALDLEIAWEGPSVVILRRGISDCVE